MNKMCYIEACTETLDTPSLLKDLVTDIKKQAENIEIPATNISQEPVNYDDLELTTGFEYETVVHKGLQENNAETVGE